MPTPSDFPACVALGLDRRILATLPEAAVPARVVALHRGHYTVLGDGPARQVTLAGRFRNGSVSAGEFPAVGDWVAIDRAGGTVIQTVAPRHGVVARADPETGAQQVLAANVDVGFIVTSANRDLNERRLERFVELASAGGIEPVVLLNKTDLTDDTGPALTIARAAAGGATVLPISALAGEGLDAVRAVLGPRRTAVLLGTSGVGKSTLTNALLGTEQQATAEIRAVDDRGRHTTVHRELFTLPGGELLIDTPGIKLPRMVSAVTTDSFEDIAELEQRCRFADCQHATEPGCAVQAAITDGSLDPARLAAARLLEQEAGVAGARSAPRGRGAGGRRPRARTGRRAGRDAVQDEDAG